MAAFNHFIVVNAAAHTSGFGIDALLYHLFNNIACHFEARDGAQGDCLPGTLGAVLYIIVCNRYVSGGGIVRAEAYSGRHAVDEPAMVYIKM